MVHDKSHGLAATKEAGYDNYNSIVHETARDLPFYSGPSKNGVWVSLKRNKYHNTFEVHVTLTKPKESDNILESRFVGHNEFEYHQRIKDKCSRCGR